MAEESQDTGERIAKVLARAGVCSRREAERLIAMRRVAINGTTLDTPAVKVTDGDIVTVDGEPIPEPERVRLWRYHKPTGLVTSHRDEQNRPTVFDHLPPDLPRVISVGRLDITSEGLLLLTNDGGLARTLELPSTGWVRTYRVRVFGRLRGSDLERLSNGVTVDGVRYGSITGKLERSQGGNSWIRLSLQEGKNREIRKVMEFIGLKVTRLIRVGYGPFNLGDLAQGAVSEVPRKVIKETLGSGAKL